MYTTEAFIRLTTTTVQMTPVLSSPVSMATAASVTADESYEDYFDPRFPRWVSVVLLILGLIGNTLSLIIFLGKHMKKNSTFIYLAFLSVVDLFVLSFGLGDIIMISYFKFVVRNHSFLVCRVHTFLTYASTHLSSFILASVSIDRAIATNLINFAKKYCKTEMANKIILLNCVVVIAINFHSLLFLGYEVPVSPSPVIYSNNTSNDDMLNSVNGNNSYNNMFLSSPIGQPTSQFVCGSKNGTLYDKFLDPYFETIDLLCYAILPFITMAICTFLIVRVIFISANRLNKKNMLKENKDANKSNKPLLPPAKNSAKNEDKSTAASNNNNTTHQISTAAAVPAKKSALDKQNNARKSKTLHLTYTLVTINGLFFALVSPLVITLVLLSGKDNIIDNKLIINTVYLLAYSNHSFNFIFYGVSSPPFRESVLKLFRLKKENDRPKPAAAADANNMAMI